MSISCCTSSISQNPPLNRRVCQLELFPLIKKRQKPQISSVPGTHPLERNRYQVTVGGKAIATGLTSDEALTIAKRGEG
jgi:hypothetical protein